MFEHIKEKIKDVYEEILFKDNFVDRKTGIVSKDTTRILATYPYIGSKYGKEKSLNCWP